MGRTSGGVPIRASSRIALRRPSSESTQVSGVPSGRDKEFTLQLPIRDNPTGTVVLNPLVPPTSGSTKPRRSPSCRGFVAPGLPQATPPSSRRGSGPSVHLPRRHAPSAGQVDSLGLDRQRACPLHRLGDRRRQQEDADTHGHEGRRCDGQGRRILGEALAEEMHAERNAE